MMDGVDWPLLSQRMPGAQEASYMYKFQWGPFVAELTFCCWKHPSWKSSIGHFFLVDKGHSLRNSKSRLNPLLNDLTADCRLLLKAITCM
jgi:hypothetical protein